MQVCCVFCSVLSIALLTCFGGGGGKCSIAHTLLPKEEQTKPEQDVSYLSPYIEEIEREIAERNELDSLKRMK